MRILVADDERPMPHLVESMLLKWGYDVIAVKDGAEAWEETQFTHGICPDCCENIGRER